MQIVIKIQEDDFEKIKNTSFVENTEIMFHQSSEDRKLTMMLFRIMDAIKHGTPLPKGHGDLVDMNQLDSKMYHMAFETDTDLQKWDSGCWIRYKLYENIRNATPVIIDADKAESEGEQYKEDEE